MKKLTAIFLCMLMLAAHCAAQAGDAMGDLQAPPPTTPPGGEIDAGLVGVWEYSETDDLGGAYLYIYSFDEDGGFSYYERAYRVTDTVNGTYAASDGRVYLSGLVDERGTEWSDQTLEYSFGTDTDGGFLLIQQIMMVEVVLEKKEFRRSDD